MKYITILFLTITSLLFLSSCEDESKDNKVINLYSAQKEHLVRPILERFSEETGIEVKMISGGASELVSRLAKEGEASPADLLLTVDIGNIWRAKELGLLRKIESRVLNSTIPDNLRGDDGDWYGLSKRARVMFYNKDKVKAEDLPKSYADLADKKWQGEILVRSSSNIYNQSLLSSIIVHEGEDFAFDWAKSIVNNMARKPQGGDRDQIRALAAGQGSIAMANSYYYGALIDPESESYDAQVANKVGIIFPEQDSYGTHINIRGGGVTSSSKNPELAKQLLEFLVSEEAQKFFANSNYEYPIHSDVEPNQIVASWGKDWQADQLPLNIIGKNNKKAVEIFDKSGWR